jgi:hypothetical protein
MASRGTKRVARRHDARPNDIAGVDRLLQADIVAVGRTHIANRRETRVEHVLRIRHRGHAEETVGEFEPAIAADISRAVEVDVHVDQARKNGPVAEIEVLDVCAPSHRPGIGDRGDAARIVDEDRGALDVAAGLHIEHPCGSDHGCGCGRRRQGHCRDRSNQ